MCNFGNNKFGNGKLGNLWWPLVGNFENCRFVNVHVGYFCVCMYVVMKCYVMWITTISLVPGIQ